MTKEKLTLPTEDHIPKTAGVPKDFSLIVFGPPKVGKTSFGASFPKSIVLECEPQGARYVRCRKVDVDGAFDPKTKRHTGLALLVDYWKLLRGPEGSSYETIVIDSLDRVAAWIEDEICAEMGLKSIMDQVKGQKGSQWGEYASRVLSFLEAWKRLDKRVIFLAHTKKSETDNSGLVINPRTINIYGQTASRVMAIVESIAYMTAVEGEGGEVVRRLSFKPGIHVEAGSRHPALADRVIDLPKENSFGAFSALFATGPSGEKTTKKAHRELAAAGAKK